MREENERMKVNVLAKAEQVDKQTCTVHFDPFLFSLVGEAVAMATSGRTKK